MPVARVVAFVLAQRGRPYRPGAAGPAAYDCSGLVMAAFHRVGVSLPHYAAWQAEQGTPVAWRRQPIRPGDLVFTEGGRPRHALGHVGVAVSATEWVVAPAPGRVVTRERIPLTAIQRVRRLL